MKNLTKITLLAFVLCSVACSSDDGDPISPQSQEENTNSGQTIAIEENIDENFVFRNNVATEGVADYCVDRELIITATITIEPGVEIHFGENALFRVTADGEFINQATSEMPLIMKAKDSTRQWQGLVLEGASFSDLGNIRTSDATNGVRITN